MNDLAGIEETRMYLSNSQSLLTQLPGQYFSHSTRQDMSVNQVNICSDPQDTSSGLLSTNMEEQLTLLWIIEVEGTFIHE